MKFKVYHVKNEKWGYRPADQQFPKDFHHVANVEASDVDEAFRLTNHIDKPWYLNQGVEVIERSRSTSVSDIIVDENEHAFRCENVGWSEL